MGNKKGFALIQVIIAASIFSIISLAMSNLIVEQRQATAYLEDQLEKVQFVRNLETVLKNGLSCQKTLGGMTVPPQNISKNISTLKDNSANDLYESNTQSGMLFIGQIIIKNISVNSPNSSGFVEVSVPIDRIRSGGGPKSLRPYKTKLAVTVDSSLKISTCGTMLVCREVTHRGTAPSYVSAAKCAPNETIVGGGGACEFIGSGFQNCAGPGIKGVMHKSKMNRDLNHFQVDCYSTSSGEACSEAKAICCLNP